MNESYILKAVSAPDAEKEMVLANGTKMYAARLNDSINNLLESSGGEDVPLVLAALELQKRGLRSLVSEKACVLADKISEKMTVQAVNLAELMRQAGKEKNE